MVRLSHPYVTTGKTIGLTLWTFAGKEMFLLFNILSRFVIAFLQRNECLLISWLQSPTTVILEPKKIKSVTVSIVSPSIYHEVMWSQVGVYNYKFLPKNFLASLVAQVVKNPPAMQTWVQPLGWEDTWRREWQPSPVFLPGEFHRQGTLVGYSPWGHKEFDRTEWLTCMHMRMA